MINNRKKTLGQALIIQMFLYLAENMTLMTVKASSVRLLLSIPLTPAVFILPSLLYRHKTGYTPFVSGLFPDDRVINNESEGIRGSKISEKILLFIFALSLTITAVNVFGSISDSILGIFGFQRAPVSLPENGLTLAAVFIKSVLIAAFCEEILFRGAVLNAFGDADKPKSTLVSAVLFALMHYNIAQTLYAFAAGVVIAFFTVRTRSLALAVLLHFGSNLITFLFTILQNIMQTGAYQTLSLISALCFAIISCAGLFIRIIHLKQNPIKNTEKHRVDTPVRLCPELAVYAILALALSILNVA